MLLWPVLLCCLLGGWAGGAGLAPQRFQRALLALPLGLGLWLAWIFLLSFVLGPAPAGLSAGALTLGWGWLLGRRASTVGPASWSWHWSAWVVLALSAVVAWLSLVGGFQLSPPRDFLIFELPRIAQLHLWGAGLQHPLGGLAASGVTPFATAAAFAGDPLRSALILAGVSQVMALVVWLALLARWNRSAPLAVVLGALFLFLGTSQGWLITRLPSDGALHLVVALVWFLPGDRRSRLWTCLPLLAGLATLDPHLALALLVAGVARPPRSLPLAALGMACGAALLGTLSGGLLAAGWLAWRHPGRWIRALALAEFLYPGSFGLAALGMALGRSLAVLWRRTEASWRWSLRWRPEFGLGVPRRFLLGVVTLLLLALAALPGEEVFNDEVLIFAQKQKVRLEQLVVPRTLADWTAWRGQVVGFEASDFEAVAQLAALDAGLAVYLTGQFEEKVEVAALVSALAGGRPLGGWYVDADGAALLPAAAAVASTGETQWLRATPARWLLRRGEKAMPVEPWPAKVEGKARGRLTRVEKWGTLLWFACDGPTSVQVWRDGEPFGPEFGLATPTSAELPLQLPPLPGGYELRWPEVGTSYRVPVSLPLEVSMKTSSNLPSRSLLPVALALRNTSGVVVDLPDLTGGRLALANVSGDQKDESPPITPLQGLTLQPGTAKEIVVYLRTPPAPGTFLPRLELLDKERRVHRLALTAPALLRTWDRRPPLEVPGGVVQR